MDVAVVGGGPAGLIAAERLAAAGADVTVYDRMPSVGRKFLLAGRGGLNLTHAGPVDQLLERYGPARNTLAPALVAFPPDALRRWCEGLGEATFVGSSGRVFPQSFKATPLLRAWLLALSRHGVAFRPGHRFLGWSANGALRFATASGETLARPAGTVLALGGASWPRLGADGGWVAALQAQGIAVTALRPDNCGVRHAWSPAFRERFAGQPLKRIVVRVGEVSAQGEAVITQDGLEGGAIYALSRPIREALEREGSAALLLDLRPDLDEPTLRRKMGGSGLSRANAWRRAGLSPAASGLLREVGGEPKRAILTVTGLSPIERAISTAGGVALNAVDERLMLRAMPGVFVAGEMLDWDAPTGGYLLQACFSTGRWAAEGLSQWLSATSAARRQ